MYSQAMAERESGCVQARVKQRKRNCKNREAAYLDRRRVPVVHLPGMLRKAHVHNKAAATISLYQGDDSMVHVSLHI